MISSKNRRVGSIYLVGQLSEQASRRSFGAIAAVSGVAEATIQKAYQDIYPHRQVVVPGPSAADVKWEPAVAVDALPQQERELGVAPQRLQLVFEASASGHGRRLDRGLSWRLQSQRGHAELVRGVALVLHHTPRRSSCGNRGSRRRSRCCRLGLVGVAHGRAADDAAPLVHQRVDLGQRLVYGLSASTTEHARDGADAALRAAASVYPQWDQAFADRLVGEFGLPLTRLCKKLSRGQQSAVGVIIGLASRAPLTFFDEPYLGLDAVARQMFYDHLLADFAEHPRTVVLSTHLIDEVSDLIEHVVLIDRGRVLIDEEAETLRGRAVTVSGPAESVERFARGHTELHRERLGGFLRVTLAGVAPARTSEPHLQFEPVSLQQLVVRTTQMNAAPGAGVAQEVLS